MNLPFSSAPLARPWPLLLHLLLLATPFPALLVGQETTSTDPVVITTTSLPALATNQPFSLTFAATGGTAPYAWSAPLAPLPPGLALDATTGTLSGTPTKAGNFVVLIRATDATGLTKQRGWNVKIPTGTAPALSIVAPNLPPAIAGQPYAQQLTATHGTAPFTWSLQSGSFPTGLTLAADGTLAGVTDTAAWQFTFPFSAYVSVTDTTGATASATVALQVQPPATALAITTSTLPDATGGTPFAFNFDATGGAAPYTWTLQSGSFPPGLTFAADGSLTGTPQAADWIFNYPFAVYVVLTDAANHSAAVSLTQHVLEPEGWIDNPPPSGGGSPGGNATPYPITITGGSVAGGATQATAGTLVQITAGPAPTGQVFQNWNGNAPGLDTFAAATSFTMPAASVTLTAVFHTPAPIPQPVTDHPRLWINSSDVAALRARATPSNPIYQALLPVLQTCIHNYTTQFFPGGQPNPVNPDDGDTQGYTGLLSEQNAVVFAFFSLIDPDPAARIVHAQRARNLIMRAMDEAVKGHAKDQPFRDPLFALFNRNNHSSDCWPLTVDWIYDAVDANGDPILTPADKRTIRDVFMIWANDCLNAYVCGGDHPAPVGLTNSHALLPGGHAYRVAANNYYAGHARLVTLLSLAIDPVDDPAVDPTLPVELLGNSLRSYIPNATGAWLYQQYAMFGDPDDVIADYGLAADASSRNGVRLCSL